MSTSETTSTRSTVSIELKGQPKSTGHIYRHRSFGKFISVYMNKEGKDLKKSYQKQALEQYQGSFLTCDLEIWVDIYFGTKRKSDWDNYHKLSMDALTGIVWEDDSQIRVAHVMLHYDKENPRINIKLSPL